MDEISINMPASLENLQLPDPSLINFYQDLEHRIFWINDEITSGYLSLIQYILNWNREDIGIPIEERKPIKIFLFSPGGDLDVTLSIIDVIETSLTPIYTYNMGSCASGAAFIFLAGHKRFMLKKAYILLHNGSGAFNGTYDQICVQVEDYQEQINILFEQISTNTKFPKEKIEEGLVSDWIIRAQEALENGACDEIISNCTTFIE